NTSPLGSYTIRSTLHPELQRATELALQEGLAAIMHDAERFCTTVWRRTGRRSVRADRCEATRLTTRLGLICRGRRPVGAHCPAVHGPDGMRPSATVRNSALSGQLVGSWTRMRAMCSITRAPILIRRSRMVANSQ